MTKILVVEDNEQNQYFLEVLLEGNGYEVAIANNGIEALEIAKINPPDLIISDILMPGMDGFALCRQWKADNQLKSIPYIFYTATYTDPKDEEFALSLGAERFIRKPTEPSKFIAILKEILNDINADKLKALQAPMEEEKVYFKEYNQALIRKLEDKMLELEKANKRLSALFKTSISLTSLESQDELITTIFHAILDELNCNQGLYFVYDENNKEFRLQVVVGTKEKNLVYHKRKLIFHLGEERGFVGLVGQTQKPLTINDTLRDSRWINTDKSIRSAMFLSVGVGDQLEGVLCFFSNKVGNFDNNITRDIFTLANNLGVQIEKTRLFEKIKQSEESLHESEKFLNSVIENIPDMIFVKDAQDLRFVRFNKAGEELLGLSKQEMYGKNDYDFFPPTEAKHFIQKDKETLKKKQLIDIPEETILTKTRGERILHTKKITILDEIGNPQYLLGISEDITEHKRAIEALRESNERFSNAFEFAPIGMSLVGINGNYLQVNHAFCEIIGYSEKELLQNNFQAITHPDDLKVDLDYVRQMLAGDISSYQMEKRYVHKSGDIIWVFLSVSLVHDIERKPLYFLSQILDISKRKRSEQLLNTLNQATIAMAQALKPEEIFIAVAKELKKLDFTCMLFPIDDFNKNMFATYLTLVSAPSNTSEKKPGIKQENFLIPIDAIDMYKEAVQEKKAVFAEKTSKIINQVFPKFSKVVSSKFAQQLRSSNIIVAPLVVEEKAVGIFLVQSDNLTRLDIPSVTAFANQLAAAWNKAKLTSKLQQTMSGIIQTIAMTVEMRDPYTYGHQKRVSDMAAAIAAEMRLSGEQVEGVRTAGIIHDLGKIYVPAEILSKPGKLSPLEFELVKTHSKVGFDLLKNIEFPWPLAQIVYQHHEKMNGSGYPQGLEGEKILIEAKIITVADVFEAMSSHRPYRPALDKIIARNEIAKNKNTLFDPIVVDAFIKVLDKGYKFPKGQIT
jgi:PAS domain S-box-containing protein/putative nucleotidyltransferase with HDIG domain